MKTFSSTLALASIVAFANATCQRPAYACDNLQHKDVE